MKIWWVILSVLLVLFFEPHVSLSGKTYTAEELKAMIARGQYPKQGSAQTITKKATFLVCKKAADSMFFQVRTAGYPAEVIVNTKILYMVKFWTEDGVVTISCTPLENKMVITRAPYE